MPGAAPQLLSGAGVRRQGGRGGAGAWVLVVRGCSRGNRLLRGRAAASSGFRSGGVWKVPTSNSYNMDKMQVEKDVKAWSKPKSSCDLIFT